MWKNKTQGALTLSFDDGYKETFENILPLLDKYKLVASFNVIAGLLGEKFLGLKLASYPDLKKATRQGMEITSHSLTHADLVGGNKIRKFLRSLPQKEQKIKFVTETLKTIINQKREMGKKIDKSLWEREIIKSKNALIKKGFEVSSFVYPGGTYNKKIKDLVSNYYLSARSSDAGLNKITPKNLFNLKTFTWYKWTTPDIANKWVDKAIKEKAWLIGVLHLVAKKNKIDYKYFTSVSDFEKHLKYIESKNIWVATQAEVVKYIKENSPK